MLKMTDATDARRRLGGVCLIAAPIISLVSALLTPQFTGELAAERAAIAAHPTQWMISTFLQLIGLFLLIPGVVALTQLLRNRAVILGHIGSGLVVIAIYFHAAVVGFALVEVPMVADGGAELMAFADTMYDHPAFTMIVLPFLGFFLGWTLLAVALWRAQVAPLWVAAVTIAGAASELFGPEALSPELMLVLFTVAFGYLGLKLLRMPGTPSERTTEASSGADELAAQPIG